MRHNAGIDAFHNYVIINVLYSKHSTMVTKMTSPNTTDLREEYEDICDAMTKGKGDDFSDYTHDEFDEYRDERDGSERLADRHGC